MESNQLIVVDRNGKQHLVVEVIRETAKTIIVRTEAGGSWGQKFSLRAGTEEWVKVDQPTHSRRSEKLENMGR